MHPLFDLTGRVAVITGGAGLLGRHHAEAIAAAGGTPILLDLDEERAQSAAAEIDDKAEGYGVDITSEDQIQDAVNQILAEHGHIDILINNAANNPKMEAQSDVPFSRAENFPMDQWDADLNVGLKGAFLCSKIIGSHMAENQRGVILNIASDLAVIAPDEWRTGWITKHLDRRRASN